MIRSASLLVLLIASSWLSSARTSAQAIESNKVAMTAVRAETLRISLGVGYSTVTGTEHETNGRSIAGDHPVGLPGLPMPLLRADYPIHALLLLGVQGSVSLWEDVSREIFGASEHFTFDVSAVARVRTAFGLTTRHEILFSIPFGPSFDVFDAGPRSYGATFENKVGWHTGLFGSYQLIREDGWGMSADIGFTWHRLPKAYAYQLEPDRHATEEVIYRPLELFIRASLMLLPFY